MIRICLTGVESTGKSTLATELAARFGGIVMPEYGRTWAETYGTDFAPAVLRAIARGHVAARTTIAALAPPLMLEDTDIVMTSAWFRMLHGRRDKGLTAIPASADRYLLFSPDTPWIDDGTRQFGGAQRLRFHAIIVDELRRRGIVPVVIEGTWPQRQRQAEATVSAMMVSS